MTEEPIEVNPEEEAPEPAEITPPPLPETGYETQVLVPEEEEVPAEEEPVVVMTAPPVVSEIPEEEPEMPSPFEQEQPEPITVGPVEEISAGDLPPVPPTSPPEGGEPKKNNTTLIIVIVVVALILLCCCCAIIVIGVSNWDEISWQLGLNLIQRLL
jgi:hypothetical protein